MHIFWKSKPCKLLIKHELIMVADKTLLAKNSLKSRVTANFSVKICYNLPYIYPMSKKTSE